MDMSEVLWIVTVSLAIALLYAISTRQYFWTHRRILVEAVAALLLVGLPFLCASRLPIGAAFVFGIVQVGLLILVARLIMHRLPEAFLRSSTRLNSGVAVIIDSAVFGITWGLNSIDGITRQQVVVLVLLFCSLLVASVFLYQAAWTLKHYRLRKLDKYLTLKDLPTVTLAVPARNETRALSECLTAAIASDYPKLEVLVLDDCSQDKTSDIIRSFAHDGVRFVQGTTPAGSWLGKNQALKTLSEQASGEYILFSGVDTHLEPGSLRRLITYALSNDVSMITVLPQRRDGIHFSTLLWQLRYYWQIVLPMTRHRLPIASQCWLIRADTLKELGGFDAVKHKIVPEGAFASQLFLKDQYRFIISNAELGVTTAKRWTSQNETALRFLYPTFKRQPMYALVGCLLLSGLVILPFAVTIYMSILGIFNFTMVLAALISALFTLSYLLVVIRAVPRAWLLMLITFPFSLIQELGLLVISMVAYEFAEVNWKGRNICYPVMTAYARLSSPERPKA